MVEFTRETHPDVFITQGDAIPKAHLNGHHIGALKTEYRLFQQATLKGKHVGFYILWRHYRERAHFPTQWIARRWMAQYGAVAEHLFREPDYNHPYYRRLEQILAAKDDFKWAA